MSIIRPEIEIVDRSTSSVRYLEHAWPSELCRWHAHEEYELHLIVATHGKAFVGDHIGMFQPGSLFLTGPLLPHNWVTDEAAFAPVEVRDMLIQFDHDGIETAMSAYSELAELTGMLTLSNSGVEFPGFKIGEAVERFSAIRDSSGLKRVLLSLEFLHRLSRWPNLQPLSAARITNRDDVKHYSKIADVIGHVVENYTEDISLTASAEMACMSASSFSRHFHATTGNRFTEFINRVRIGQACVKLYETDERISSICFEVGFRNLSNFNRQFVRIKGITPRAYRDQARKELSRTPGPTA